VIQLENPPGLPKRESRATGPLAAERLGPLLALAMGIGFAIFRTLNSDALDATAGPLAPIAFGVVWGSPGLIGLLAGRRRPALFLGAGMLGTMLAVFPLSLTVLLLIPAGMCFAAYGRRAGDARGRLADPIVGLLCMVGGVWSFVVLFMHEDPRCLSTATSQTCGDIVTATEAAIALAGMAVTILLAWAASHPRSDA
jgi:hypothetical protein